MKNKDKKKLQAHQDTQTPSTECTKVLITSLKPDDQSTNNVLEPNTSSMFNSKIGSCEDKMYADSTAPQNLGDQTGTKDNNQLSLNLDPHIESNDIFLSRLPSPDYSSLFGAEFRTHAENEIRSTLLSSDERSIMQMLEELWSAECMIIEPNLGSPN